jgi:hypothetical protein
LLRFRVVDLGHAAMQSRIERDVLGQPALRPAWRKSSLA